MWLYNEATADRHLKVATVAISCDRQPFVNREKLCRTVEAVSAAHPDVDLILFGEMTLGWYKPWSMSDYHRQISESIPGETTVMMADLAKRHSLYLSFGLSEIGNGRLYNAQVLLNPSGEIQAVHRKCNLKQAEADAGYEPGPVRVTTTMIQGVCTSLIICSDAASPRVLWELMRQRPDLILFSLADDKDEDRFVAKAMARLFDAWIISANRYGYEDEDNHLWNGHLVVSDPLGCLRAQGQDGEQVLTYDIPFVTDRAWLVGAARRLFTRLALPPLLLRHWRQLRAYL